MTHFILSSWKRPGTRPLILCLALMLALAACGSSTTPGSGDLAGGANATATSGSGSGSSTATASTGGSPTATPSGSGTPDASAPPFFFTVRATASNSAGDYTIIDNVATNGDPNLALFVTANYNPNGAGGVYDNHPLGVFYISGSHKWAIYHDDKTPYIPNASYNVWARETSQPGTFIWRATASNSGGDYTIIDNPATNGNPNAVILVTHNWNPGGVAGVYENHRLGVYYIGGSTNKWAIYHQDKSAYTPNANYNVYATVSDGATRFVARACSAPCTYDYTTFNSSVANAKPGAIVFVTANWNPGGTGGVYDDHNLGVFYSSGYLRWAVFHQDTAAYIANSSFNIVIPQPGE
ncbi:MAG TPA: hypothetical protein VFW76_14620 [Ktedonobacterales bacterium]|nr:hypothetical protein [Ktedonobacterales bacterium]